MLLLLYNNNHEKQQAKEKQLNSGRYFARVYL